jgi:hypothetical protein
MSAMSDLLAIVGPAASEDELLEEIAYARPDRVTVLVESAASDWGSEESEPARALRDRIAGLLARIERRTGAIVVGIAGNREQLRGWRFDRVVGARAARARTARTGAVLAA